MSGEVRQEVTKSSRIVDYGDDQAVEIDMTLTLTADTVMAGWPAFMKALQALDGVLVVRIEDTPPALVKAMLREMGASRDRPGA